MIESSSFLGFVIAALIVLLVPGPGVLYIIARTLGQGQRAGLVSTVGLAIGALFHVAAATVGLSAILLASSTAFGIVKYIGAAYLVYLGIRTLISRRGNDQMESLPPRSLYHLFIDGIVISVFNPKVAVFFLAFLPQFVDPTLGPAPQQILFLGIVYVALALCTDGAYAVATGHFRNLASNKYVQSPLPRLFSGFTFLGLGISTAILDRR